MATKPVSERVKNRRAALRRAGLRRFSSECKMPVGRSFPRVAAARVCWQHKPTLGMRTRGISWMRLWRTWMAGTDEEATS